MWAHIATMKCLKARPDRVLSGHKPHKLVIHGVLKALSFSVKLQTKWSINGVHIYHKITFMYENLNVSFPLVWLPISDFHKRQLMRSSIRCYDWFSDTHLFENLISFTPAIYISTNQEPITWAPAQIQFYELKGVVQNPSIKTSFIVQCWLL